MFQNVQNLAREAGSLLSALQAARPLVQCVTNFVSMDLTANALLALGATPAMAAAPEEADEFAAHAGAIVCNIGTLSRDRIESLETAAAAARARGKPWVLDPVGVGATRFRAEAARALLNRKPALIRGNASEIMALSGIAGAGDLAGAQRGIDTADGSERAIGPAVALARALSCVVAATGPVDFVTDGQAVVRISAGSPMMARVTAMGCALSAAAGAFLAVARDPLPACVAAVGLFGLAGERAAIDAAGPASFRLDFIDRLYGLTPDDLEGAMLTRLETSTVKHA